MGQSKDFFLKSLSDSDRLDNLSNLVGVHGEGVLGDHTIMMEGTVGESLSGGVGSQVSGESERFSDGKEGLDHGDGSSGDLILRFDFSSLLGQTTVNLAGTIVGAGNLDQEVWLLESWGSLQLGSGVNSSRAWDKLTTSSMDGIGMEGGINDVDSHSSQNFFAKDTVGGDNLESSDTGILDFVHELTSLGLVDDDVGSLTIWAERPDFQSFFLGPSEFVHHLDSFLSFTLHVNFTGLNSSAKFFANWFSIDMESVMLVCGLGHS